MSAPYQIGRYRGKFAIIFDAYGKRRRFTLGTSDRSQAERLAPALYAELTRPPSTTVADLWEAYVRAHEGRRIASNMKYSWKALQKRFGNLEGNRVTVQDCEAHIRERREKGIKDHTLHGELGHLRIVLRWAEKEGLIDKAPTIKRPPLPQPTERALTREEVSALIRHAPYPHIATFIILGVCTAGRLEALLELTWDRVDFRRGRIMLEKPGVRAPRKGRAIVPMNDFLRAHLLEAKKQALSDYVIEWNGKPVKSVRRAMQAAVAAAGIPKATPHDLRHTAAVHMAEAGVPMEEISQYLGHSSVEVTRKIYARYSPDYLKKAASVLSY